MLLKSYKVKSQWDRYKKATLDDVMAPHLKKAKRRDIWEKVEAMKALEQKQEDRLLNTLKKAQILHPADDDPRPTDNGTVLRLEVPPHKHHSHEGQYAKARSKSGGGKPPRAKFELPVVTSGPLLARRRSELSVLAMSPKSSLADTRSLAPAVITEGMDDSAAGREPAAKQ